MTDRTETVLAASRIVTGHVVHAPGWVAYDTDRHELFRRAAEDGTWPDRHCDPAPAVTDGALLRAVRQTSVNPAMTLRRPDVGALTAGSRADLIVLGPNLQVREVIRNGSPVAQVLPSTQRERRHAARPTSRTVCQPPP